MPHKIQDKENLVAPYVFYILGSENFFFFSVLMSFNYVFVLECLAGKIFGKLFQKVQLKRYDTYFIYLRMSFVVTKPATN